MYSWNIPRKHNITLDTTGRQRMLPGERLVEPELREKVAAGEREGERKERGGQRVGHNRASSVPFPRPFPSLNQGPQLQWRLQVPPVLPQGCSGGHRLSTLAIY